jgi:hypothetical protein
MQVQYTSRAMNQVGHGCGCKLRMQWKQDKRGLLLALLVSGTLINPIWYKNNCYAILRSLHRIERCYDLNCHRVAVYYQVGILYRGVVVESTVLLLGD